MTRQATDQLYIEVDYFTPEEYYVYTAEAQGAITSQSTISCDAVKIVESAAEFTSQFTQTATISHIEGADLFAFSEAELAAIAARIRFFNLETLSAFDIATDYGLIKQGASTEAADFALAISAELSRGFDIDMSAAFSLTADVNIFRPLAADLAAESNTSIQAEKTTDSSAAVSDQFSQTADAAKITDILSLFEEEFQTDITAERIRGLDSAVSAATEFSAVISHIHGADLIVNGFATVTADVTVDYSGAAALENVSTVTSTAVINVSAQSNLTSAVNINGFADVLLRNTLVTGPSLPSPLFDSIVIDNTTSRFGNSIKYTHLPTIAPRVGQKPIWTGTEFKIFEFGWTWSSADGLTWTRAANNIDDFITGQFESLNQVEYAAKTFVIWRYETTGTAEAIRSLSSTNGVTWVQQQTLVGVRARAVTLREHNGFAYVARASDSSTSTDLAFIFTRWNLNPDGTINFSIAPTTLVNISANSTNQFVGAARNAFVYRTGSGSSVTTIIREEFSGATKLTGSNYGIDYTFGTEHVLLTNDGQIRSGSTAGVTWTLKSTVTNATKIGYRNNDYIVTVDGGNLRYGSNLASLSSGASGITDIPAASSTRYLVQGQDGLPISGGYAPYYTVSHSTDLVNWNSDIIEGVENIRNSITYTRGSNPSWNTFKSLDFWIKRDTAGTFNIFGPANTSNGDVRISAPGATTLVSAYQNNNWTHIRLVINGNNASLYTNGVKLTGGRNVSSVSNWPIGPRNITGHILTYTSVYNSTAQINIDEFLITNELLNDPSAASITVPTAPWKNTAETDLLLHFDNSFADDSFAEIVIAADLVSQSTVTAASTVDYDILVPAMVTQSSLTAQGFRTAEIVLTAFSAALVLTEIDIIKDADAELTVTAEVVTDVTRIQEAASAINSTATVSSDVSVITDTAADFNNTFALSTVVEVTRDNAADLSAVSDVTAAADRIRDVDAALQSQSQVVAEAVKITTIDSALVSTAELLAVADRSRDHLAALTSDFVQTAQAEAILSLVSSQSAEFTVTAQGFRTAEIVLNGFSAALVLIDVERIRDTAAELQDQFTVFVQTSNVIDFDIDPINAAASLDGSLDRIRFADSSLSSELLLDCSVLITRDFSSDLTTDSSVAIEVSRILTTDSNIYAVSDLNGSLSVIRDAAINTSSTASMTVAGATVIFGEGHLFADTTLVAQGFKITEIVLTAFGNSTVTTEIEKIAGFESTVLANFIQDAAAVKIATNDVAASAEFNVTALVERSREFNSNIDAAASIEVTATKAIEINASIVANSTLVAQGFKTTEIVLTGFSAALVLTAAERIRDTAAAVASAATATASITVVQQLSSDMSAVSQVTATAGVQVNASAALQSIGFVLTTAREIRLDSIVYKIGSETRVYKIPSESRIYKIRSK
jgi:hypothetical protein